MAAPLSLRFLFLLISAHLTTTHGVFSQQSHIMLPIDQKHTEKLTHLHIFYHEILEGKNPTVVKITSPSSMDTQTQGGFGTLLMMDSFLTEGPELGSKPVGKAQGMFGVASLEDRGMVMLINLVFTEGDYAGSTLSMLGRNPVMDTVREMPIVGGTGVFRFARGYLIAKSIWEFSTTEHFLVEYDITVSHI